MHSLLIGEQADRGCAVPQLCTLPQATHCTRWQEPTAAVVARDLHCAADQQQIQLDALHVRHKHSSQRCADSLSDSVAAQMLEQWMRQLVKFF